MQKTYTKIYKKKGFHDPVELSGILLQLTNWLFARHVTTLFILI